VASPDGTLRIQFEPVVNVGHVEVPCVGRVRLTVFCGNVGRVGACAQTFAEVANRKITSTLTRILNARPFLFDPRCDDLAYAAILDGFNWPT
jgi:hypothetical protein